MSSFGSFYRPDHLHESLNIYISQDTYVFEPATFPTSSFNPDGSLNSAPMIAGINNGGFGSISSGIGGGGGGGGVDEKIQRETLTVDRRTGKMTLNAINNGPPLGGSRERVITCFGIIGFISLATTDYLLVITSRTPSCRLLGHPIYMANDFRLLPLSPLSTTSTILDHPVERELVSLVEQGLRGGKLWFSYGWDLTNSLQRQYESLVEGKWRTRNDASEMSGNEALRTPLRENIIFQGSESPLGVAPDGQNAAGGGPGGGIKNGDILSSMKSPTTRGQGDRPMWKRADDRFFWNKFLMQRMIEQTERGGADNDLSRFILPIMYGSVELRSAAINNRDFLFALISRRSRYRAGTRYFARGIDQSGHCANFNETEQILLLDPVGPMTIPGRVEGRERLSFVQTRGSVPVFWAEVNNLRYKPDLQIMDIPETTSALRYHLAEQIRIYDEVWLVNLVNQKGHEQPVKEAFEKALVAAHEPRAHYVYFDFHHECRGLRFDRIQLLVDSLSEDLNRSGYFHIDTSGSAIIPDRSGSSIPTPSPKLRQTGVIRSNCMDCLDRTNVAQAALAKDTLQRQLRSLGVLSAKETIDEHPEFMHIFRNVWADHADTISKVYSGTGALKTDFTRTGRRTKQGAIQDGVNSVMRYVRNNFFDGTRQDAFDLLTGAWVARRGAIPPLVDVRPLLVRTMPYVFIASSLMISAGVLFPRYSAFSTGSYLLFWIVLSLLSISFVWSHGTSYVAWPRLNPPYEVLNYEGPGHRTGPKGRGVSLLSALQDVSAPKRISAITSRATKTAKPEVIEMDKRKRNLID